MTVTYGSTNHGFSNRIIQKIKDQNIEIIDRNKLFKFCSTFYKFILNFDLFKQISVFGKLLEKVVKKKKNLLLYVNENHKHV